MSAKSLLDSLGNGRQLATTVHDLLVAGPLKFGGSWGGEVCRSQVSVPMHIAESSIWMIFCYVAFKLFNLGKKLNDLQQVVKIQMSQTRHANDTRMFDKLLATVHFAMYLQLIYYKWNFSSLISLVQPCHVILLLEGIALASNGPLGMMISALILPALSGTFLALLFPDTTGLSQPFEEQMYWIQHYMIITIPIYLLQRRNGLACNLSGAVTIGMGVWALLFLHFSFYEVRNIPRNILRNIPRKYLWIHLLLHLII